MIPLVGSVLLASLLGSPHCAGMCGGFVAFYAGGGAGAGPGGGGRGAGWLPHAAYNGGRLVSYALLGIVAGALGVGVDRMGALAGVGRVAAVGAGLVMAVWGGATLLASAGVRMPLPPPPALLGNRLGATLKAVREQPPAVRALVMGLVTTLIPCGWLYAFVAVAGGTAHPLAGAAVMALFWLGTLPVMAGLGLAAQRALGPVARRMPVLTATLLVVFGLLTVAGKFRPMGAMHHPMPGMGAPVGGAPAHTHDHR
ncbi:MAG TPA: sulfite exporter TauE/SafE family protein [Dongiaceae bacterium]|nr:sulfite exporter TauE/SafE family protein [Dongiaceae bacterium]